MTRLLWRVGLAGAVLALLSAAPRLCAGQGIGVFLRHDRLAEYTAGAGLNLLSRGPWIAPGWRRPVVRFVGVQLVSVAYERLFDYGGLNWNDARERLWGYVLTEAVIDLGQLVFRHKKT